ncbi:putative sensor domain DACNV-containing protein [Sorangium sp. So ce131]|uniref:putative sensor domain DACNV-containing protein n=1 Tax=Sorangium sp. So ce131 TaxID=3133282 RepID=UPI003F612687
MALHSPDDFAARIDQMLANFPVRPTIDSTTLREIVTTMFYATLGREEGREISFGAAFLDKESIHAHPRSTDVWCVHQFENSYPLSIQNLVKLAGTANPKYSALILEKNDDTINITGIVRMSSEDYRLRRGEVVSNRVTPLGCLILKALGPARLEAEAAGCVVAEYNIGIIIDSTVGVLGGGPVYDSLIKFANKNKLDPATYIKAIRRTLLNVRDRARGSTVIIVSSTNLDGLSGGYRFQPPGRGLPEAILYASGVKKPPAGGAVVGRPEGGIEQVREILKDRYQKSEFLRAERVMSDATAFAADLCTIDGALILHDDLSVASAGTKIESVKPPDAVLHALDAHATEADMRSPIVGLGTRHQSAAAAAWRHPGSLVFVVSEDGVASAMLRPSSERPLLIWRPVALDY